MSMQSLRHTNLENSSNCGLWSSTTDAAQLLIPTVSSFSSHSIPLSPPEPERLYDSKWNKRWDSDFLKTQPFTRTQRSVKKYSFNPTITGRSDVDDDAEFTFRRVHVIPYQGDPLDVLINAGKKCRDLMLEYALAHGLGDTESTKKVSASLLEIFEQLEELFASGITPSTEIEVRPGSDSHRRVLAAWLYKTGEILRSAPYQRNDLDERVNNVTHMLQEARRYGLNNSVTCKLTTSGLDALDSRWREITNPLTYLPIGRSPDWRTTTDLNTLLREFAGKTDTHASWRGIISRGRYT